MSGSVRKDCPRCNRLEAFVKAWCSLELSSEAWNWVGTGNEGSLHGDIMLQESGARVSADRNHGGYSAQVLV